MRQRRLRLLGGVAAPGESAIGAGEIASSGGHSTNCVTLP